MVLSKQKGKSVLVGQGTFNMGDLITNNNREIPLQSSVDVTKGAGTIGIKKCDVIAKPGFLEYIRGGIELNAVVAVDLTGSNGDPRSPDSLHSISP
mmetsp:Transcript_28114/g.24848  ORF Transcript_28114/g.24848 Transcript_28114/m.24848 type:complete len:96 (+) Transcript_28114:781-1068(+)